MIKINGNYYNLESSSDEIIKLANEALNRANEAFDYFLNYIGLIPSLFSHLKNISIIIDNNEEYKDNMNAYFIVRDNSIQEPVIHLIGKLLDDMIVSIKKDGKRNGAINELAWSIIHERIHSNRCIIINNLITLQDTRIVTKINIKLFREIYDELESLLSIYYNPNKKNKIYDILKIKIESMYYEVYAYNEKEDKYEIFLIDKNDCKDINLKDLISEISDLLSINYTDKYSLYSPYASVTRLSKYNEEDMCMNYDFYSNGLDVPFSLEEAKKIRNKISLHEGIEESLTEALAGVMIVMNKNRTLSIYEACDCLLDLIDSNDVKLALNLIKKMSLDDIRWFIISCYKEEYENRFSKLLKEDYSNLLLYFNNLYKNSSNEYDEDEDDYLKGLEIIKKL